MRNIIGEPFTEIDEVESTNNYAMALAQQGFDKHGAAWFAHTQTGGKGQRGKQWHSASGQNIILSVLLNMKWLPVSRQFYLSIAIALAVRDFFFNYTKKNITIKWPNDIYYNDRKAAGILIENIIRGNEWQWAIAGIGANINQIYFDDDLPNPVSLKQITVENYDVVALAKELCKKMQQRFAQLQNGEENILLNDYNNGLYKKGEKVKLKIGDEVFECFIKKVNEAGQLIVEGYEKNILNFGEAEWLIK